MKRPIIALLFAVGLAMPGCPIYDDEGCSSDSQCAPGYQCNLQAGTCYSANPDSDVQECFAPSDCRLGATCDRTGTCRSVDCSWDDVGCVDGYSCEHDEGVWRCLPEGLSQGGAANAGGAGGALSGGAPSAGAGGDVGGAGGDASGGAAAGADAGGQSSMGGAGGQSLGGQGGG